MIIVITGPTAVGKTKLSIELAKHLNGEIINADSTQIFKCLDIATAKVTQQEMDNIPHHLIDIKDINEDYTVYDYQIDCRNKIEEIKQKGKTPIIVGGTGLYIKAALYDYKFEEEKKSSKNYTNYETIELYNMLDEEDKKNIHPNNRKRIVRALEYFDVNNKPLNSKEKTNKLLYDTIFIGLTTDRQTLYNKINKRVDEMINNGLIEEALNLYKTNIRTKAIMTPIGYKELFEYFDKKITLEEAVDLIKQRSRRYAKRQYTWFNNQMNINWFETDYNNFNNTIDKIKKYIGRDEL